MNDKDLTTYQAVVLQSRAHRAIKTNLTQQLRDSGITMMQWSIIGLVADSGKDGVRISDLAHALDTSLAFITTSVNVLEAKGVVVRGGHTSDNRAKLVRVSEQFAPKVPHIEDVLKEKQQSQLYSGLEPGLIEAYFKVLRHIAKAA